AHRAAQGAQRAGRGLGAALRAAARVGAHRAAPPLRWARGRAGHRGAARGPDCPGQAPVRRPLLRAVAEGPSVPGHRRHARSSRLVPDLDISRTVCSFRMRGAASAATVVPRRTARYPPGGARKKGPTMPTWLIILLIGVVLLILGVA